MDIIYLKIKIYKADKFTDEIRDEGLFFEKIADAIELDRDNIVEIDEYNYKNEIKTLKRKFDNVIKKAKERRRKWRNDKNRSNKKGS